MTPYTEARSRLTAWMRDYGEGKSPEFLADICAVLREAERLRAEVAALTKPAAVAGERTDFERDMM